MAHTTISWTDLAWNPTRGCSIISEGCRHCYAMRMAHRLSGPGGAYEGLTELGPAGPRWNGKLRMVPEKLLDPQRWRRPKRIFVNSMSDLFHENLTFPDIDMVHGVMLGAPQHIYQVLTKRPGIAYQYYDSSSHRSDYLARLGPHLQIGVSIENQPTAELRIPMLLSIPADLRFISAEPLLGEIDLTHLNVLHHSLDALRGEWCSDDTSCLVSDKGDEALDWVIVGGESGQNARPFHVEWAQRIVQQCRQAGVACFLKQLGANTFEDGEPVQFKMHDSKGSDPAEWPADLRVQEFPHVEGWK